MTNTQEKKPRAVILSSALSQPRYHRRAAMLLEAGYNLQVYGYQRGYYEENTYPDGVQIISLGQVESRHYIRRIPKLLKSALFIKKYEKQFHESPALVYAFGLDMALIGNFVMSGSIPLIYEIGDIQNPLPHTGIASKMIAITEKLILRKCRKLVVTSPAFIPNYFERLDSNIAKKSLVIENKLARESAQRFPRPQTPKQAMLPIKIGYIGAFKYRNCILSLMEATAKKKGKFELHFYGDGSMKKEICEYANAHSNISYHGSFSSSADLGEIYRSIDLSYVVYDSTDPNVRMAIPNKLYEGPYFGVPLVVAKNTFLAERVRELRIGFVIDPQEKGSLDKLMDQITPETLRKLSATALDLDRSHWVENYSDMISFFKKIGEGRSFQ